MPAIPAVPIGVVAPYQLRIALTNLVKIGVIPKAKHPEGMALSRGEAIDRWTSRLRSEARGNSVERIGKIGPGGTAVAARGREGARCPVPPRNR